jgi:thiamine kinase-like enzyme
MAGDVSDDAALERVKRLPIWSGNVEPKPLAGGITNKNFVVDDRGRKLVVRTGGDIVVHGIVRANEIAANRAAHAAGLSPEVVYTEPGVMVIGFIDGKTFTPDDVRKPENLERLAELVRRCHRDLPKHLRGAAPMFWPFHVVRDYAHTLKESGSRYVPQLVSLLAKADDLEAAVGRIDVVFGHNDLLAANILDDGKQLWLLDWEYAGFNSPLFDLGGLASNSEMTPEMSRQLLEIYFGQPADASLMYRAHAMSTASLLRESVWSMVSELHSKLDFDYAAYTADYLSRFDAAYTKFKIMDPT